MIADEFQPTPSYVGSRQVADITAMLQRADNINDFVFSWLSEHRSVTLCAGINDDEVQDAICIVLKEAQEDVAMAYVKLDKIFALWPELVPVSAAANQNSGGEDSYFDVAEDAWFEARDARLKATYSDIFCASVIKPEDAIQVALSYAVADAGEAFFEVLSQADIYEAQEDMEPDEFCKPGLIRLMLNYSNSQTGVGWGEYFYVA